MNNTAKALPTFVLIDFESNGQTGADGKWDTASQLPTEVAAVRVVDGEITSTFNTLIEYTGEWTPHLASEYNHHSQDDLRKGMPEQWVTPILWNMIQSADIIIAYNALYDIEMFYHMLGRMSQQTAEDFKECVGFIDPLTIARDRHPYPHKLGDMCKLYGIELDSAHLALDDALATVSLVLEMHKRQSILEYLNIAGYKAQYGAPTWLPKAATLKPQGNVTVYHTETGADVKTTRTVPSNALPRKKAPALPKFVPANPKN